MGSTMKISRDLRLTDGTSIQFVDSEWVRVGSGHRSTLVAGSPGRTEYKGERLTVWRHKDGRVLIEGVVLVGLSIARKLNELVPATGDVRALTRHIAMTLLLSQYVLDCCIEGIDRTESL